MKKILGHNFFNRPAPKVALDLLGKYLVREINGIPKAYIITETESYEGTKDLASHASKGRTKRNEIMFGKAGIFYVYLVYGMHTMLNIVTGKKDHPGAVLIRGVKDIPGPGRLTKVLNINLKFNALPAVPETGIWFEDSRKILRKNDIQKTPRIGVAYAGPVWSKKLWRFVYKR
jgi:DNA-3-methyladenine glycosylase